MIVFIRNEITTDVSIKYMQMLHPGKREFPAFVLNACVAKP